MPNLISKHLVNECYNFIFFNCTSLAMIKIGYTGEYNDEYFNLWVNSVAESGNSIIKVVKLHKILGYLVVEQRNVLIKFN